MQLAVVGAGRLGRSLKVLWERVGHTVHVVGRDLAVPSGVDAVVLTVPDRAIAQVAAALGSEVALLHTSGATTLDVLAPHERRGSLHPMMTFPGPEVALPDLAGVMAAVEGATPEVLALATRLALDLGLRPIHLTGDRRLYHASAALAGNFATVLLAQAGKTLAAAGLDETTARELLLPLALQSLRNSVADPWAALTGPAARGDLAILDAHRDALRAAGLGDALATYEVMLTGVQSLRS